MFFAAINKPRRLVYLAYLGLLRAEELNQELENLSALAREMTPGFRVLADFERLETMDPDCAAPIGKIMELCEEKQVSLVVRVMPDPTKDIGMNILAHFHYEHPPQVITVKTMAEAFQELGL